MKTKFEYIKVDTEQLRCS